ncbi:MAG TPA: hypothetical protein VM619_15830 [Luteimonas sp.]|nr:hypothetical protein [Luteimonas sp.]
MTVRAPLPAFAIACLCALLAACAAPATSDAGPQDPAAKAPPKMSRPLPPTRVRQAPVLDHACKADADCAVKNVGNCCGAMPACVNKDSPVDPAAVQSQCAQDGRMGVCGFREISSCSCNAGRCEPAGDDRMRLPLEEKKEPAR